MNSVDQKLVNTLEELISNELYDSFQQWICWATQIPDNEMGSAEPSSEGLSFVVDYMIDEVEDGNEEPIIELDDAIRGQDKYEVAVKEWMADQFKAITYTQGGDIWMSDEQADLLFELYEQAINNISKREITRGI